MYLSFINDEIEKLQAKIEKLESVGEALEESCDEIIEELRETMREAIFNAVSDVFAEYEIEDNYYNEKEQEVVDSMMDKITSEI